MNCGEDCPSNEKDRNALPCCNCERRNAIVKKEEEERKRMKENVKLRNRKAKMGDIQDIQKEIEIIKNEMTDLKKMLQEKPSSQDSLQKEAEFLGKLEEPKPWKPERGEEYFAVEDVADVVPYTYCEDSIDEYNIQLGNCFRTKERAEQVTKKMRLLLRLEQLHDILCPDYEPDWGSGEATYCLYYDHSSSRWAVDGWYDCNCRVNGAYFDTLENAEKVAEILNKELEKSK